MARQREMSAYEYAQANDFIYRLYIKYAQGMEFEECRSIAFLEYVEVRKELEDIYDREFLWLYSKERIITAFKKARQIRNEKIRLEARCSLNQMLPDSEETIITKIASAKSDFANSVCMWNDLQRMEEKNYKVLRCLYRGAEDWEIMQQMRLSADDYFAIKQEIRERIRRYIEE